MKPRALRVVELTPDARIDAAKRKLADAIDELIEARLAKGAARSEWVDQNNSPLPKWKHLDLVRRGVLSGVREGRRVLIRRADLDAYLQEHAVKPRPVADDDVDAMIAEIAGGGRR